MPKIEYPDTWLWETMRNSRCGKPQNRSGPGNNEVIVIHTTDGPHDNIQNGNGARATAAWQNRQRKVWSGYHFLVDKSGVVGQCNPRNTKAYHAGRSWNWKGLPGGGNKAGIGVSLFSQAHLWPYQDTEADRTASAAILDNAAQLLGLLHDRFGVPLSRITVNDYRKGARGMLGHMDIANRPVGRKPDPGKLFPWDELVERAKGYVKPASVPDLKMTVPVNVPPGTTEVKLGKVETVTPAVAHSGGMFEEAFWEALQAANATPRSVAYTLRFYREVAALINVPGDKPEAVANRLMSRIRGVDK